MMSVSNDNAYDDYAHPLDGVEDVLERQNWTYSRMNRDELFLELRGQHGIYRMMFLWHDSQQMIQLAAEYDLRLADFHYHKACVMVNEINERLSLGFFSVPPENMIPCFRFSQMLRGMDSNADIAEQLEYLIDVTMEECDAHYPAFMMLASEKTHDEDQLALALMPAAGLS